MLLPGFPRSPAPLAVCALDRVGVAMRGLIKRVALVAGAAVVLLGLAVGMADAVPGGTWDTAEHVS